MYEQGVRGDRDGVGDGILVKHAYKEKYIEVGVDADGPGLGL